MEPSNLASPRPQKDKYGFAHLKGPPTHLPELHFGPGQKRIRITWRAENMPIARLILGLLNQNVQDQTNKQTNPEVTLL